MTGEELALLDQLHDYIQAGGYITVFICEFKIDEETETLPFEQPLERNGNNATATQKQNGNQLATQETVIESPLGTLRCIENILDQFK